MSPTKNTIKKVEKQINYLDSHLTSEIHCKKRTNWLSKVFKVAPTMKDVMSIARSMVGKKVWISGATQGFGLKISECLVEHGCAGLAVTDIVDMNVGESIVKQLKKRSKSSGFSNTKIIYFRVDVRESIVIERTMRAASLEFNGLDIVINNAGVSNEKNLIHTIEVNTIACIRATEKALEIFDEDRKKKEEKSLRTILNISSASGVHPFPGGEYYSASKHAVVGYSRSIAINALKKGVRVLCFCPAWIDVGMGQRAIETRSDLIKMSGSSILTAEEVTRAVLYMLCSQHLAGEIVYMSGVVQPTIMRVSLHKPLILQSKL